MIHVNENEKTWYLDGRTISNIYHFILDYDEVKKKKERFPDRDFIVVEFKRKIDVSPQFQP